MKLVKMVLLAGISSVFTSFSVFAVPLNITLTGTAPVHRWGDGLPFFDATAIDQFEDLITIASQSPPVINLAGVNSINLTWNAPAGYMYVVNPPPADFGALFLEFQIGYGFGGDAASLGSITASSVVVHTIYGNSSWSSYGNLAPGPDLQTSGLLISAGAGDDPNSAPFAFDSITVSLQFSQTGKSTGLRPYGGESTPDYYAGLFGGPSEFVYELEQYEGPPDPGQLLTMEPLPTESTPDDCPTLGLAGFGFAGLLLLGRTRLPIES